MEKKNNEENGVLRERFALAMERIGEIAGEATVPEAYQPYFRRTAGFILTMEGLYGEIKNGHTEKYTLEEWQTLNRSLYQDILPEHYEKSYANPDYALEQLGETHSRLLCFLYTELRTMIVSAFEQRLEEIVVLAELFIEVYNAFEGEELPSYREIQQILYWFKSDYSELFLTERLEDQLNPDHDFAKKILMEADLSDLSYLYKYGEYISDNELKMAEYINQLSEETVQRMADVYSEGLRLYFVQSRKDLSKKKTVNVRFMIGFERMIRKAVENFRAMGLEPVIYRAAPGVRPVGYCGGIPNKQFAYDHRADEALFLDGNYNERRLGVMRTAYEKNKELAAVFAGPACQEVFGGKPFAPVDKESACHLSERQQKLALEYQNDLAQLRNRYINGEETGFTVLCFPTPEVGEKFPEIFREIIRINTLDYKKYQTIQQTIIDTLDQGVKVHVLGRGANHTDITVALHELKDPAKETIFENCVADCNIPVGEVFTSPKLAGTNGVLEVTETFLAGFYYKDLRVVFRDGMVTEYHCSNFDSEEKNLEYLKETIMNRHESLPIGEFAIGTNTTAYAVSEKYGIGDQLPVLIAEKMGPHFAVGDTCYSWGEDCPVYNPDGKEIIARDNEVSILRKEDVSKAYFGCHTDITVPYKELGAVRVIKADGSEISIIENGRFVLPGTEELNEPLDE